MTYLQLSTLLLLVSSEHPSSVWEVDDLCDADAIYRLLDDGYITVLGDLYVTTEKGTALITNLNSLLYESSTTGR